jgi:hypothetical protein
MRTQNISAIREEIINRLQSTEDYSVMERIWNLLTPSETKTKKKTLTDKETNNGIFGLTDEHKKILNERRAQHLSGESKSYTLEEVKAHARASRISKG